MYNTKTVIVYRINSNNYFNTLLTKAGIQALKARNEPFTAELVQVPVTSFEYAKALFNDKTYIGENHV